MRALPRKPLPGRRNIVITRGDISGVETFRDVASALAACNGDVWFIGGAHIYAEAMRYADVIDQRIHAIKSATPLTTDEGIIVPHALLVQALVTQLRVTLQAIEDFDHAIAQRAQ